MRALACAAAALAAAGGAAAQDIALGKLRGMSLADVLEVNISTGTSKLLRQAPATAYVVTADDIARLGARNVLEVLEAVPGLNVHLYQGQVTNSPMVDMRGSFTQRSGGVLFLRDGKPLRLLGNLTMPEIFKLPVQFVERIEIARGPGSSVYGADALVGTVDIITRKKPREAGARVGDPFHHAEWAGYHGAVGILEWSAALTHTFQADEAVTRSVPLRSSFTQEWRHEYGDLDLKLRAGPFSANAWLLDYYKDERGHPGNPRGQTLVGTQQRQFDLGYERELTGTTKLTGLVMHTRFRGLKSGEVAGNAINDDKSAEVRSTVDAAITETRFGGHRLRLNVGGFRERRVEISPPNRPPGAVAPTNRNRYDHYAAVQDEWAFAPGWELTAGLRVDRYSDYGTIRNPRAGLVWSVSPQLTTKLLVGEAYRSPLFNDPGPGGSRPEHLRNAEIVADYRPSEGWSVIASAYRYRAKDLLDQQGPNTTLLERDGWGGEVTLGWQASAVLRIDAGLAYADVKDHATKQRVPLTTREIAKLSANWRPAARWNVNLRWEAYFHRYRPASDPRPPLEDFNVGHVAARYDIDRDLSASLVMHNILDKRAWLPFVQGTAQDVQLLERSAFVQLDYRF